MKYLAVASLLCACAGLLDVEDPQRFTDQDVDESLEAVADGVEGMLHESFDEVVAVDALFSDIWQHTGTWQWWDDVDHGRVQYDQSDLGDWLLDGLLRARFAAHDAQQRFSRLRTEGRDIPAALDARVKAVDGLIDLLVAEMFCEAPAAPGGGAFTDRQLLAQALEKLQAANADAGHAKLPEYSLLTQAATARAHLMLGHFAEASAAAAQVPTEFSYQAIFSVNGQTNDIVTLATFGFNHMGGMREKWWSQVDVAALALLDPFSGKPDPRMPIRYEAGGLGVDGVTPFYSQWKYKRDTDDIEIIGGTEMRLIEAEVHWENGDYEEAVETLNVLRTTVGLGTVQPALTREGVLPLLLHERLAERFLEGGRANDLSRLGVLAQMVADGDFNSPSVGQASVATRPVKFPMSEYEARLNPSIENDVSLRCAPTL